MAFYDRLKESRVSAGLTQDQLAQKLGIAKSTLSGYESGNREPSVATIAKLLDVLNIDANYLYQDEIDALGGSPTVLKYDELRIVEKYRALDEHGKESVNIILDRELLRVDEKNRLTAACDIETGTRSRMINYYFRLASAGTGQILFDTPPTKRIEIPDIPEFQKADYAIGVNGDSMEPTYQDGDTLLVEMAEEININDIGIFLVDDECFVKQLGYNELISLNHDYPNIPLNEGAKCMGKVIGKL